MEMQIIRFLSSVEYKQFSTYKWVVGKIFCKAGVLNQDIFFTPGLHIWFTSQIRPSIPKCYLQSPTEYNPITAENVGYLSQDLYPSLSFLVDSPFSLGIPRSTAETFLE